MSKYSPGPWLAEQPHRLDASHVIFRIVDSWSAPVANVHKRMDSNAGEAHGLKGLIEDTQARDNARLITAAPDLLAALEGLLAAFNSDFHDLMLAKLVAKAAITQATGGGK